MWGVSVFRAAARSTTARVVFPAVLERSRDSTTVKQALLHLYGTISVGCHRSAPALVYVVYS